MEPVFLIVGIVLALLIAVLHSLSQSTSQHGEGTQAMTQANQMQPVPPPRAFSIAFDDDSALPALSVAASTPPELIVASLGLSTPHPSIFITGGAGLMSDEDYARTRSVIEAGLAAFAQEHDVIVIDGGTDSGVMRMIGEARQAHNYDFPLIGVTPEHRIAYPGKVFPDADAELQRGHSHFVLVDSDEWGGESQMIIDLCRTIAGPYPKMGILINGGAITEREVYLATTQGEDRIPILVLEGSGRKADEIGSAFRTGQTKNDIIRTIIAGGDLRLTSLTDGPEAMLRALTQHFLKSI